VSSSRLGLCPQAKYSKGSAGGVRCSLLTSLSVNMIYSRIMRRVIVEKRIIAPDRSTAGERRSKVVNVEEERGRRGGVDLPSKCCGGRLLDERQIAPLVVAGARNIGPMRVAALAVGEEGEEEEGDEEEEAEGRTGHHHGARGPAMRSAVAATVGGRSQWSITTCPIFFVLLLLPVWIPMAVVDASPLHPAPPYKDITRSYIRYYEAAIYDTVALKRHRNRIRRDVTDSEQPLILNLKTLDSTDGSICRPHVLGMSLLGQWYLNPIKEIYDVTWFRLKLSLEVRRFRTSSWTIRLFHDASLFSKDVSFESTNGPISFDTSHSYVGTVLEDESAVVQGVVTQDGLFDGSVVTRFEEYYIEPTSRYLNKNEDTSPPYHSIAYRTSDVTTPPHPLPCASHQLHQERSLRDSFDRYRYNNSQAFYEPLLGEHVALYSRENNARVLTLETNNDVEYTDAVSGRDRIARHLHKRATVDPRKTTCMLYLQADHQFFARYGTEEACIEVMTRHVQRVNSIYKHTDFNQDGRPDNISFMIKRVKVHSENALRDPHYRFPGNYGVEKYLELFSEEDYDAFCLAYMFTYRDFEMGTLGLAWTGDLKNAGGVCEKNGHYRGSMKSLNTGIVTLLNYGKHVPPAVSHVTLAHEIGHNFGSPHDPEQCTPGGEDGNFIMFARATSGDKRNNNRFSPCSLNAINPVLNSKARSPKGCFTEPQVSLCGNGVVEEGEQCDCGWEEDCRDLCCYPQRRYPPSEETPCTLTPHKVCSPSQGPCCTSNCNLRFGDKCRDDNGCRDASFCDGRSPYCPPSINKPNKTICNRELVCFMGECTGSICLAYGLESCQCIPGPNDPPTKACELCCRLPGENQPCLSSFDWNSPPYDIPDMFSKPGTPCNDYNGYCDVFQKCREVDPSGPLATLRKLLLSDESLATFRRWVAEHWYAAVLIVLAAISLLVASMRLLGKRPDLKLKSVTIIHSSTTETVRLPPEGTEGVTVHPPAVRAKLPLSRKVREKRCHRKHKDGGHTDKSNNKDAKKKQNQQTKRSSTGQVDDFARKRPAEVLAAVTQENKRKKITSVRDKGQGTSNNPGGGSSGDNDKRKRKKQHRKEVIDYSAIQADKEPETNADPKSKVRSWLLASSQCRPETGARTNVNGMPKSKSTPVGLTASGGAVGSRVPVSRQQALTSARRPGVETGRAELKNSSNSLARKERARLQVVYKPPFRFSVKLRKSDKVAQAPATAVNHTNANSRTAKLPRTGVLLRTAKRKDRVRIGRARQIAPTGIGNSGGDLPEPANSDLHTVPSDLEVLLSESEFLFSDT
ncbi:Disintegrin and metalloproteinase domain-containing protein 10, partial [Trachymyrmex cornetzi]